MDIKQKVLFFTMPNISLWRKFPYIEPSLGPALVVGGLKKENIDVTHIDLNLLLNCLQTETSIISRDSLDLLNNWQQLAYDLTSLPTDLTTIFDKIDDATPNINYDCVALSLPRLTIDNKVSNAAFGFLILFANNQKKKRDIPVMAGGQVIGFLGENEVVSSLSMFGYNFIDYLFLDDGSITLPKILSSSKAGTVLSKDASEYIAKNNERIYKWTNANELSLLIPTKNPEQLLFHGRCRQDYSVDVMKVDPSFKTINSASYPVSLAQILPLPEEIPWTRKEVTIAPYKFVHGCSHRCAFCKAANLKLFYKSPEETVQVLRKFVDEEGISNFRFFNSQINFSNKYVREFCNEIAKNNLNIKFSDSACFRNVSDDTFAMLREAGCVKLWFGVESPNDRILKLINKSLSMKDVHRGLLAAHKAGIWIGINIIVGFPHETEDEFKNLCKFMDDYKDIVNCWSFSSLEIHHSTPMFQNPSKYGIRVERKYKPSDKILGYAFSEINGLDSSARQRLAEERVETCYNLLKPSVHKIYSDDYVIFSLYSAYNKKTKIQYKLDKYIKRLNKQYTIKNASSWLSFKHVHDSSNELFKISQKTNDTEPH